MISDLSKKLMILPLFDHPALKTFTTQSNLFPAVVAMETRFKNFVETGQNLSKSKLKIGPFHIDC